MDDIAGSSSYDAACANWGGLWRLPTKAELEELKDKCIWTWTTGNGHNGYRVHGPSGKSIFLPAAGWCSDTMFIRVGELGNYWGATPVEDSYLDRKTYGLGFHSNDRYVFCGDRFDGKSVRPVSE